MKLIIKPPRGFVKINLKEIVEYKDLLIFLIKRNIKVRYAQTIAGLSWAIINPIFQMIIFTFVFDKIAKIDTNGVPYPIFSYSALVPWVLFSSSLNQSTNSLTSQKNLITKVYFPRLIIPLSTVLSNYIDYLIAFVILLIMMQFYSISISLYSLISTFVLSFLIILFSFGLGSFLTSLSVQYRDIKHGIGLIISIWVYATPVAYPLSSIPENFRMIYSLNPMVGIINSYRNILLGTDPIYFDSLLISFLIILLILFFGIYIFNKFSGKFADVV